MDSTAHFGEGGGVTLTNAQSALAEDIKNLVVASEVAATQSIEKALEAGHRLLDAKDAAPHGTWLPFLERVGVPERKAQRLMTIARSGLKSDTVSDLGGIKAALKFLARRTRGVSLLNAATAAIEGFNIERGCALIAEAQLEMEDMLLMFEPA